MPKTRIDKTARDPLKELVLGRTEADHCRELFIRLGERNLNAVHPFFDQFFCDFQKV